MTGHYNIPDPLPWADLAGPLALAEDALARLDERLSGSPIREGWIARTHFADAAACVALQGELVRLEDLVLHDARMDVRAPSHELTRSHAVLRARRRIANAGPAWALSPSGLDSLRGRAQAPNEAETARGQEEETEVALTFPDSPNTPDGESDAWAAQLSAIDAVVARSERALAGKPVRKAADPPAIVDADRDEDARLAAWSAVLERTAQLPPVLAAALAAQAWGAIAPLRSAAWLGRLLVPALLRARGKTQVHLLCLNSGLRTLPGRRHVADGTTNLPLWIEAISAAATAGLKEHDRWLAARNQLERKLVGRRSTSKLPALIELALATPIASAGMIAARLGVTPRAAQDLVAELGLREATGRGRYRAWGIV